MAWHCNFLLVISREVGALSKDLLIIRCERYDFIFESLYSLTNFSLNLSVSVIQTA